MNGLCNCTKLGSVLVFLINNDDDDDDKKLEIWKKNFFLKFVIEHYIINLVLTFSNFDLLFAKQLLISYSSGL